ncbi:hypothetical protein [Henriciella marina]|nr:hypothetical protein [Henriciella marina]
MIAGAGAAYADPTCGSLTPLLRTVDAVYEIAHEPSQRAQMPFLGELEAALSDVSLIDLYGDISAEELDVGQTAMILFTGELNIAMERLYGSEGEAALQRIERGVPRLVRTELARLQKELSCSVSDILNVEPTLRPHAEKLGSIGDPARASDSLHFESESAIRAYKSSARQRAPRNANSTGDKRGKALASLGFPLLLTLGLLASAAYWCRPRIRRWKKRAERHVCYRSVPVRLGSGIHDLTIVDFNIGGLRMKHDGRISRKRPISFQLGDIWLRGNVVWTNDCYAGVRLSRPLSDTQISALCFNTNRQRADLDAAKGLVTA